MEINDDRRTSVSGFQVMPPLSPDERAELEASIVADGVQVPILVAPDGTIIDGHHRDEIARKHALHCPRIVAEGDAAKLRGLAFKLNLNRRHLTREQKRALVAESIKADPQLSDREHGRRAGVSKNTAAAVRDELVESGQVDHFHERVDPRTGNASQPATKPRYTSTRESSDGTVETVVDDRQFEDMSQDEIDDALMDEDAEFWEQHPDEPTPAPRDTTPPQEPTMPTSQKRRRPLEEGFFDATDRLNKAVTSLENLGADDRLPRNKEKVARYRGDLLRAIDALQCVAEKLNSKPAKEPTA